MDKSQAKELYRELKNWRKQRRQIYNEKVHCPLVLEIMSKYGTMTEFCVQAKISDALFYKWTMKFPLFNDCYLLGKMISKANWEREGRLNEGNEDFDHQAWRFKGATRYGYGRNRVKLFVDHEADPYTQYKQLIKQASTGEFSASELKQIMESINVGRGAFETFELQSDINDMKNDLVKMKSHTDEHNSRTVKTIEEAD